MRDSKHSVGHPKQLGSSRITRELNEAMIRPNASIMQMSLHNNKSNIYGYNNSVVMRELGG